MDITIRKELAKYVPLINMLGDTLGPEYEIVLHDLTIPKTSVVYVINSKVTGRKVGQGFNCLIDRVLLAPGFNGHYLANYEFTSTDGRNIRSSSIFLRDANDEIIGAICINFDADHMQATMAYLNNIFRPNQESVPQPEMISPPAHIDDIVDGIIERIIPERMSKKGYSRREKMEIILQLDKQGIFQAKRAIEKVSERLNISTVTVYSYLDECRKTKKPGE